MYNNLGAAALAILAFMTWSWPLLLCAALLAWPVQWLLREQAKKDPQFSEVYRRALKHPYRREAHGRPA